MHFESPWAFLLLLLVPALAVWRGWRRGTGSLQFPSTEAARRVPRSWRQRLLGVSFLWRAAALLLLAVALARPQRGVQQIRDVSQGIAIEMVVDRSSSMAAEMEYRTERLNRLEVVKRVFTQFVAGNRRDLRGRPNDLIGMIAFARYPDTVCPLTLAHGALAQFVENVRLVQRENEDGTAIGDAVALAAARLKTAEETLSRQVGEDADRYEIKSKVIILLTDGQNNCGQRSPLQAAGLAAEWGIKIHAIGVGGGVGVGSIQTPFGTFKVPGAPGVDEQTLKAMARQTGGRYRRADDAQALHAVYREIDEMERSELESVRYMDYRETFTPLALAALALVVGGVWLEATVLRRIP